MKTSRTEPLEKVILHDVDRIARKSGRDCFGNLWVEFDQKFLRLEPLTCAICGKRIETGWLRLPEGCPACDEHVAS